MIRYWMFTAFRFVTSLAVVVVVRPDFIARGVAAPYIDNPVVGVLIQIFAFLLVFAFVFGFLGLFKPRRRDSGEQQSPD